MATKQTEKQAEIVAEVVEILTEAEEVTEEVTEEEAEERTWTQTDDELLSMDSTALAGAFNIADVSGSLAMLRHVLTLKETKIAQDPDVKIAREKMDKVIAQAKANVLAAEAKAAGSLEVGTIKAFHDNMLNAFGSFGVKVEAEKIRKVGRPKKA